MSKVKSKWFKINDLIAKKWRFFFWRVKISKLCWILSDELGCVFNFLLKKKTHPNSSPKIQKGAFFCRI